MRAPESFEITDWVKRETQFDLVPDATRGIQYSAYFKWQLEKRRETEFLTRMCKYILDVEMMLKDISLSSSIAIV